MKNMSLKEITVACKGFYYGDDLSYYQEVTGVAIDSRKIETGFLFVPIRGTRVDGHTFIPQVMAAGALCTLSEKRLEGASHPYILVDSCQQALKDLAEHYRQSLHIKVVGITGSVGKTSTKETIASILAQKYNILKTEGNYNNEIGLPLTIFNIREEHEIAILELGISEFGEMHRLAQMARPDICVITNIGCCHLENLKSQEGILKAKSEIFDYLAEDGQIVLNGDDDLLCTLDSIKGHLPLFFGSQSSQDAYFTDVVDLSLEGLSCTLHLDGDAIPLHIPIPGAHMAYNAAAGALVGNLLGLNATQIQAGIAALTPVSGRSHIIHTEHLTLIDDCYNANPVSMKSSLAVLSSASGRKVAVLGDMFELGCEEQALHYEVGVSAATYGIDVICCIGDLSVETAAGARFVASHSLIYHFHTKHEFLEQAPSLLRNGDTVLIKASHGMEFPELVENLQILPLLP
ncbi:MAG: UDP-N-acetylmuramoyl-tripeptide--D-alanyl-D-alanine ligase [Lachnospiraceae bacterium]